MDVFDGGDMDEEMKKLVDKSSRELDKINGDKIDIKLIFIWIINKLF
jgi:hypothetical protein